MLYTTLNRIRPKDSFEGGWTKLLRYLDKYKADDDPLPLATIVKAIDLDGALHYCRNDPQHAEMVLAKAKEYFPAREEAFCNAFIKKYSETKGDHAKRDDIATAYGYAAHFMVVKAQTADFLQFLEDAA